VVVCNSTGYASGSVSNLVAYYMLGNGDGSFQQPVAFGANSFIGSPTQVVLASSMRCYLDIAVIDGVNGLVQVLSPFGNPGNPYGPEVGFDVSYGSVVTAAQPTSIRMGSATSRLRSTLTNTAPERFCAPQPGQLQRLLRASESLFSSNAYYLGTWPSPTSTAMVPDIAIADPAFPTAMGYRQPAGLRKRPVRQFE